MTEVSGRRRGATIRVGQLASTSASAAFASQSFPPAASGSLTPSTSSASHGPHPASATTQAPPTTPSHVVAYAVRAPEDDHQHQFHCRLIIPRFNIDTGALMSAVMAAHPRGGPQSTTSVAAAEGNVTSAAGLGDSVRRAPGGGASSSTAGLMGASGRNRAVSFGESSQRLSGTSAFDTAANPTAPWPALPPVSLSEFSCAEDELILTLLSSKADVVQGYYQANLSNPQAFPKAIGGPYGTVLEKAIRARASELTGSELSHRVMLLQQGLGAFRSGTNPTRGDGSSSPLAAVRPGKGVGPAAGGAKGPAPKDPNATTTATVATVGGRGAKSKAAAAILASSANGATNAANDAAETAAALKPPPVTDVVLRCVTKPRFEAMLSRMQDELNIAHLQTPSTTASPMRAHGGGAAHQPTTPVTSSGGTGPIVATADILFDGATLDAIEAYLMNPSTMLVHPAASNTASGTTTAGVGGPSDSSSASAEPSSLDGVVGSPLLVSGQNSASSLDGGGGGSSMANASTVVAGSAAPTINQTARQVATWLQSSIQQCDTACPLLNAKNVSPFLSEIISRKVIEFEKSFSSAVAVTVAHLLSAGSSNTNAAAGAGGVPTAAAGPPQPVPSGLPPRGATTTPSQQLHHRAAPHAASSAPRLVHREDLRDWLVTLLDKVPGDMQSSSAVNSLLLASAAAPLSVAVLSTVRAPRPVVLLCEAVSPFRSVEMGEAFATANIARFVEFAKRPDISEERSALEESLKERLGEAEREWQGFWHGVEAAREQRIDAVKNHFSLLKRTMDDAYHNMLQADIKRLTQVYESHIAKERAKLEQRESAELHDAAVFYDSEQESLFQLACRHEFPTLVKQKSQLMTLEKHVASQFPRAELPKLLTLAEALACHKLRATCVREIAQYAKFFIAEPPTSAAAFSSTPGAAQATRATMAAFHASRGIPVYATSTSALFSDLVSASTIRDVLTQVSLEQLVFLRDKQRAVRHDYEESLRLHSIGANKSSASSTVVVVGTSAGQAGQPAPPLSAEPTPGATAAESNTGAAATAGVATTDEVISIVKKKPLAGSDPATHVPLFFVLGFPPNLVEQEYERRRTETRQYLSSEPIDAVRRIVVALNRKLAKSASLLSADGGIGRGVGASIFDDRRTVTTTPPPAPFSDASGSSSNLPSFLAPLVLPRGAQSRKYSAIAAKNFPVGGVTPQSPALDLAEIAGGVTPATTANGYEDEGDPMAAAIVEKWGLWREVAIGVLFDKEKDEKEGGLRLVAHSHHHATSGDRGSPTATSTGTDQPAASPSRTHVVRVGDDAEDGPSSPTVGGLNSATNRQSSAFAALWASSSYCQAVASRSGGGAAAAGNNSSLRGGPVATTSCAASSPASRGDGDAKRDVALVEFAPMHLTPRMVPRSTMGGGSAAHSAQSTNIGGTGFVPSPSVGLGVRSVAHLCQPFQAAVLQGPPSRRVAGRSRRYGESNMVLRYEARITLCDGRSQPAPIIAFGWRCESSQRGGAGGFTSPSGNSGHQIAPPLSSSSSQQQPWQLCDVNDLTSPWLRRGTVAWLNNGTVAIHGGLYYVSGAATATFTTGDVLGLYVDEWTGTVAMTKNGRIALAARFDAPTATTGGDGSSGSNPLGATSAAAVPSPTAVGVVPALNACLRGYPAGVPCAFMYCGDPSQFTESWRIAADWSQRMAQEKVRVQGSTHGGSKAAAGSGGGLLLLADNATAAAGGAAGRIATATNNSVGGGDGLDPSTLIGWAYGVDSLPTALRAACGVQIAVDLDGPFMFPDDAFVEAGVAVTGEAAAQRRREAVAYGKAMTVL